MTATEPALSSPPPSQAPAAGRWSGRVGSVVQSVRHSMTPGQRQTALIGIAAAACAVAFGLPAKSVVRNAAAAPVPPPATPAAAPAAPRAKPAPLATPVASVSAPLRAEPALSPPSVASTNDDGLAAAAATPAAPPRIVAVVRTGESNVPGRDEPAVAAAFLQAARLQTTAVTLDPTDPGMCQKIASAGDVVLSGRSLGADLRNCLVTAGRTVVSADELGAVPAATPNAGQVLSTRRGLADTLLDLGQWAQGSGALRGKVGLVGLKSAAPTIAAVTPALRSDGVNIVDTALVADDQTATVDVANAVLDFASKGVDAVLFAVPVSVQDRWVAQSAVVAPNTRYVVSDGYDGVANEAYPPSFDGAAAYTSLRVPWYARAHGASAAQSRCDSIWNAAAVPPTTLPGETVLVYEWCQNVGLVAAAMEQLSGSQTFAGALATVSMPAPLTSDLGPLPGGGYGPTQSAALAWRSSCACWQETSPFADRLPR